MVSAACVCCWHAEGGGQGQRSGSTAPTAKETTAALKEQFVKWQKLQTEKGSQRHKEELLAKDTKDGITLECLQAVGSFYIVTELPPSQRMGDVWYTCSCGDAEHDAMCVHIIA